MNYKITALDQLGLILKGFRKEQRLTQGALAAQLGVSQQAYAQMEANPCSASIERLFRVLRVLGVDLVLSGPTDIDLKRQEALQEITARLQRAQKRAVGQQESVIAPKSEQNTNKTGGRVKAIRALNVGRREQQELTAPAAVIKKREVW